MKPARVVVVEDSLSQRAYLVDLIESGGSTVVAQVGTTDEAVSAVQRLKPDVVTMDLEIPGGGGIVAIQTIMARNPVPILVLSSHITSDKSVKAIEALGAGALDALPKPTPSNPEAEAEIQKLIKTLRGVPVIRHQRGSHLSGVRKKGASLVAIAASTGGPKAVAEVLSGLSQLSAPILITQHLHADFIEGFVKWMAAETGCRVLLAEHGAALQKGSVYVAPAGVHLKIDQNRHIVLDSEPPSQHCPSADEMFRSVAKHAGADAIGVILTGMGADGAEGLLEMRMAGGLTIAQDKASSIIFGMPAAAQRMGAVVHVLPLEEVPAAILQATGAPS